MGTGLRFDAEGSQARGLLDEVPTRFATPRLILANKPFFFFFGSSGFLTSSEPRSDEPSLIVPVRESTSDSVARRRRGRAGHDARSENHTERREKRSET